MEPQPEIMETQPENPRIVLHTESSSQGLRLTDMPTEMVHRIGDFLKPKENGRLGIALGKSRVATQILMDGKRHHAASKIQSYLKSPVYMGVGESQRKHNILFKNHPNPRMLRRMTQTPASRGRGIVVDKLGRPIDIKF
eukprot:SAG11_NODE_2907_length_2845_cov_449.528405_7_plen_139_part_00